MARVIFEGFKMDDRTRDMLVTARGICWAPLTITQGAYSNSVSASAGTHDGGGVIDIGAVKLSPAQRDEAVASLRKVGFAAWLRTPAQSNWPFHIHCVAVGCPDLSGAAKAQVTDYKNNRNGLASHGQDDGPRSWVTVTWEYRKAHPLPRKDDLTVAEADRIIEHIDGIFGKGGTEANRYSALQNGLNAVGKALASQGSAIAALAQQIKAEDVADDAALTALIKSVNDNVDALEQALTSVVPPAPKA